MKKLIFLLLIFCGCGYNTPTTPTECNHKHFHDMIEDLYVDTQICEEYVFDKQVIISNQSKEILKLKDKNTNLILKNYVLSGAI